MKCSKTMLRLYAITDPSYGKASSFYQIIEQALKGGITCLQLREKNLSETEYIQKAKMVKSLCKKYDIPLIINDNYYVAVKSGADGVHIGQQDEEVAVVRKVIGPKMILGVTAKTVDQAIAAEKDGADYLGCGAMFISPTKPSAKSITPDSLRTICRAVTIPVCAIGGINGENMAQLQGTKISGIAMASGIFSSESVETSCKKMAVISETLFGGTDDY